MQRNQTNNQKANHYLRAFTEIIIFRIPLFLFSKLKMDLFALIK